MRVAQHRLRNAVRDLLPGLSIIGSLVDPRVAIVDLMTIDGEIRSARVVTRSFDIADRSPGQHVRNVLRDVSPVLPAIAGDLHETIVGARPNHARLFG